MTSYAMPLHHRREATLLDHLRVRWMSPDLDRRLADGADPESDRLLQLRAARLLAPATRAGAATGIEGVIASVGKPKTPFSSAVPVRRRAVRGARRELMALAGDLRCMQSARPRGVAVAALLVTDPSSPLYTATSSEEIVRAVRAAEHWLSADPVRF